MSRADSDPGLSVVRSVFDALQIDEEWSAWEDRGFIWWPHQHAQRVWADPPVTNGDLMSSLVHAEVELIEGAEDADIPLRVLDAQLGVLAAGLTLHSAMRRGDRVCFHATASVYDGTVDWIARVFQVATLFEAVNAETRASQFADAFGMQVVTSAHPVNGPRPVPDEMLRVEDFPATPNAWGDAGELDQIADFLNARGMLSRTGGNGLTAELPYGPNGGPAITGGDSHLLTLLSETRGRLGAGARLTLRLGDWPRQDGEQIFPPQINAMEAAGLSRSHLIGTWAIEGHSLAIPYFTSWIPGVLHRPGILMNLVLSMAVRARWISTLVVDEDGG